jgi:excinuclease ABC subunit A
LSGVASADAISSTLSAEGFLRFFDEKSKTVRRTEEIDQSICDSVSSIPIVVDRLSLDSSKPLSKDNRERLISSITQAFSFGHGRLEVILPDSPDSRLLFAQGLRCPTCNTKYNSPRPSLFSFNSPLGACSECTGFGKTLEIDPELCIPDQRKSIREGAIVCWATDSTKVQLRRLKAFCAENNIDIDSPWRSLSAETREILLTGPKTKNSYKGLFAWFKKLERKRHRMHVRVLLSRYRSEKVCVKCNGTRIASEALQYRILERTIADIWQLPLNEALLFFDELIDSDISDPVTLVVLEEIRSRLAYLCEIGLAYLTLDRQSRTLSGGESQRVNLTAILGAQLVNTMLVLDEPTIGLHTRDTQRLLTTIKALRDRGNTLVVVEHDTEVIAQADRVIDIGPESGQAGGEILFQGPVDSLATASKSLTARYFHEEMPFIRSKSRKPSIGKSSKKLSIKNARANNLDNIDIDIPLNSLVVLSGISGSGKSTLVNRCLHDSYRKLRRGAPPNSFKNSADGAIDSLKGTQHIDDIVLIDQSPIGKSPRSNPATYSKAWDSIRECLAETEAAQQLGLSKSAFSFNVEGGRCPNCSGAGQIRVEMQFLADVFVECEACGGTRFQDSVLGVRFAGKNVVDLLNTSLSETIELFSKVADSGRANKVTTALKPLVDLGLGYLTLGHPLNAVSGGEAQRIKLASYLNPKLSDRCLFILDEPTTGLHPHNVQDLLRSFDQLLAQGHSILCVEHNLDVIRQADWIIDLGPDGGNKGGRVVAQGSPETLTKDAKSFSESATVALLTTKDLSPPVKKSKATKRKRISRKKDTQYVDISGARHNNLKDVSTRIPHNLMSVVTGVSGSGKSTLAFDIVFAEGQRRYIDCLSPYARQYIKQLSRADVDRVHCIPPTVAISQKTSPPMGVSTIATLTELYQYLRLLYSKLGTQHCVDDGAKITSRSPGTITGDIIKQFGSKPIMIFAPVVSGRKGYYNELFNRALRAEIFEAKIDGEMCSLEADMRLERHKLHYISLKVASFSNPKKNAELLQTAIQQCLVLGNGMLEVYQGDPYGEPFVFNIDRVCPSCSKGYRELDPQDFSFRSARGVCTACSGRGTLPEKNNAFSRTPCPECSGSRIASIGRNVTIEGKRIHELTQMTAPELLSFLENTKVAPRLRPIAEPITHELINRLRVLVKVGLDYLQLDRDATSISGGEAQRLRLAKALGAPLTGVCYILDEPSIGLHPRDHSQLIETLHGLRDAGNTVIVVEHDEDTIREADYVIDIGPRGGAQGGNLVYEGPLSELENCAQSLTGQALRERSRGTAISYSKHVPKKKDMIVLRGAHANNLKNITATIPKNSLSVIAGVSGAGKSSLLHSSLVPAIVEAFEGEAERKKFYAKTWESIDGIDGLESFTEIDQSPVSRTPTSTPASYLGIFDQIRKVYALLPEAKAQGWTASHFSFNTGNGKCSECSGRGYLTIPMSFLPDATTNCEVCRGKRYNEQTLDILYQGFSIGDLLQKTFTEARSILSNHSKICRTLDYVLELGLGYLTLGQPTHTLSGGEAQRIKIARELGRRDASNTLYVLDEPTIGLHMVDVEKLLLVLRRLVDKGNTVVAIEHNMDIVRAADYLIEMGPDAGDKGGRVLYSGPPKGLVKASKDTPTKRYLAATKKGELTAAVAIANKQSRPTSTSLEA